MRAFGRYPAQVVSSPDDLVNQPFAVREKRADDAPVLVRNAMLMRN
jgi:hypothetical protein